SSARTTCCFGSTAADGSARTIIRIYPFSHGLKATLPILFTAMERTLMAALHAKL
ncbi:13831_t:CDS:1, partial [Dentiscutata heterogama]